MDLRWAKCLVLFWSATTVSFVVARPQPIVIEGVRKPRSSLDPIVAKGLQHSTRHSVSPFSKVSLGKDHCSPFDVYLKACKTCGYQLEITGQTDVTPLIHHIVDAGTLKLGVVPPGFSTKDQLKIVVTVPLNATLTEVNHLPTKHSCKRLGALHTCWSTVI